MPLGASQYFNNHPNTNIKHKKNKRMKSIHHFWLLAILLTPFFAQAQININVDDAPYNAVGDGVTNDHDAIQDAIWALRSNGGTLNFTSGKTYIIASGLTFNAFPDDKDYLVTSSGAGKATIKIQDGTDLTWDHWGFRLSESKNITLRNLIIDGNRATRNPTVETSGTDVLFIDGASDGTRLENLDLINSPADNLYIVVHYNQGQTMMTDFEMHNCTLDNGFRNNMSVISGANFKIIGCTFSNANGHLPEGGIDFEPNAGTDPYSNMLVEGCLFKDNRFGVELTYIVNGCGTTTIKDNLFENNGILVASKDNNIHHNIFVKQDHQHAFDNTTRDGIIYFHTDHTSTGNDVHHNYFYDNNMPAGSHLIKFMSNSGGGNNVHDNYAHGNVIAGFVADDTDPDTNPGQTQNNNSILSRKEMGYWNMDAIQIAGNDIVDLSDFDHNGTITGATSTEGVENEALDFAPDDRYITIPANNNLDIEMNFSVLAWVKWNGVNAAEPQQVFVGRGDDWKFGVSNTGQVGLHAPFTAGDVQSPANSLPTGEWKLVTATYDGRHAKVFIDAVEVASEQANGALGTALANLYIGSSNGNTSSFNGAIDDVRIFNYSLDQVAIQAIFAASPLSVEWLTPLTATKRNSDVLLKWTVAQQINNEKFEIMRSADGIHFKTIQSIDADGSLVISKEFKALDTQPLKGDNYYIIKQIDFDGQSEYSNIAYVRLEKGAIDIYPNPARHTVFIDSPEMINRQIDIFNTMGQLVMSLTQNNTAISITDLPNGLYWVRITMNGQTSMKKLIKE